ncbi:MAG: hypothetical protein C0624_00625 [Desulfuromonas sp.]|nr:MAG: hypothetical protein C0624_00625 [Desulfuromonas sp.]
MVRLIGFDTEGRNPLAGDLKEAGYEVVVVREPEDCPAYYGKGCHQKRHCSDVLIIEQFLSCGDALSYVSRLSETCPGSMAHVAILAAILSPDDLVKAIELGCKVMFRPVLAQEVVDWFKEIGYVPDRLTMLQNV